MAIPLDRDVLQAAYDYLCTTIPFSKWNLPDSDDVTFRASKKYENVHGRCTYSWPGKPQFFIEINQRFIGQTDSLMRTMAHEMLHIHQKQIKARDRAHGPTFKRFAEEICRYHGFDPKLF